MQEFQIARLRPPTENFSLSISTHFYCPWSKCEFCPAHILYKEKRFKRRTLDEIKNDINNAAILNEYLWDLGLINQHNLLKAITEYPNLKDCFIHLACWYLYTNASYAFLGGSNPILYHSDFLSSIISNLKATFPSIKRVTCYGRTITASKKKDPEYFKQLYSSGLSRIHAGIESGSDRVLKFMNKGVTSEQHILGGQKIKDGGISLSVYVMPGLGGKKWSLEHALETARVINEIEPDYVRLRTLEVFPFTPLYDKLKAGQFEELTEEEVVEEERILIEHLNCKTKVTSDSAANLLTEIWGDIPGDKKKILKSIDNYLELTPNKKIEFSLQRRLEAYNSQYGGLSRSIEQKITKLSEIPKNDKLYFEKMQKIIKYIRRRLIP